MPHLLFDRRFLFRKIARALLFRLITIGLRRRIEGAGFRSPDAVYGLLQTGHMDESCLLRVLDRIEDGLTEIYFHPGDDGDPDLKRWQPAYDHAAEAAALLSPKARQRIRDLGIRLTSFEEAAEG
jgi:hypothetical protein